MNRTTKSGAEERSPATTDSSAAPASDLSTLFHYPAIGRLFENSDTSALSQMRQRLTLTSQNLERVIRQGTKDDAERAARALRAVGATLGLLDSLENLRQQGAK